jgi:hypothetical protein
MSTELVSAIQRATDLRLILPFGLNVKVGDVVSVSDSGDLSLEGIALTVLGIAAGRPRPSGEPIDVYRQSGKGVSCEFRAAGKASSLFPQLPKALAKVDVQLGSARSWVLAITNRRLASLPGLERFRAPILAAYSNRVWRKDMALVTSIATADAMTLLAARSQGTRLALTLNATVAEAAAIGAQLTASPTVAAVSNELTQSILHNRAPVAFTALKVKDGWLRRPRAGALQARSSGRDVAAAPADEFWELATGAV